MFYDRFEELCARKGVKVGRACAEMGVSRSLAAKWKSTGTERPSAEVLEKMAAYFGMSIDEILGKEKSPGAADASADDQLKFALFNGVEGITDAMLDEVRQFAQMVKLREEQKKKG